MGNGPNIRVEFIVCHFDYKAYYDQFLDKQIHILVGGAAQLQWKFEACTPEDLALFPDRFPMKVKVNYRKCAQHRTTRMLPCVCPSHSVTVYKVYLMTSAFLPSESPYEHQKCPGMSFFKTPPVGLPSIMSFQSGWHADFVAFLSAVNMKHFAIDKYTNVREEWADFAAKVMPYSDSVAEYLQLHQVPLHLSKGLWKVGGSFRTHDDVPAALSTLEMTHDAFSDMFESRRSALDLRVEETLRQEIPTITNRHLQNPPRVVVWRHRFRGMLISVPFTSRASPSSSQQQQQQVVVAAAGAAAEVINPIAVAVVPQQQPPQPQLQPQQPVMAPLQPQPQPLFLPNIVGPPQQPVMAPLQPQPQPQPLLLPNIVGAPQQPQLPLQPQPQPQPIIEPPPQQQQQNPPQRRAAAATGIIYKIGEIITYTPATPDAPASYRCIFQQDGEDCDHDVDVSLVDAARERYAQPLTLYSLIIYHSPSS